MDEAADDPSTPPANGLPDVGSTILFLPGAAVGLMVAGVPRVEGWIGPCPAREVNDLVRQRRAVVIPDDFSALPPPAEGGESLQAYLSRAVFEHLVVRALVGLGPAVKWEPPPSRMRPSDRTVPPVKLFPWVETTYGEALRYYHEYFTRRLLVRLFDELRAGTLVVFGMVTTALDYILAPVSRGLWRHPGMVLDLSKGSFQSEQQGPRFDGLILHRTQMAPYSDQPAPAMPPTLSEEPVTPASAPSLADATNDQIDGASGEQEVVTPDSPQGTAPLDLTATPLVAPAPGEGDVSATADHPPVAGTSPAPLGGRPSLDSRYKLLAEEWISTQRKQDLTDESIRDMAWRAAHDLNLPGTGKHPDTKPRRFVKVVAELLIKKKATPIT